MRRTSSVFFSWIPRSLALLPALLAGVLLLPATSLAADTEIIHEPVESAVAGFRIGLSAVVSDPAGVEMVRAYFKAFQARHFSSVALETAPGVDGVYVGVLPAPVASAQGIEYLLLVKNGANEIIKTQTYRIEISEGDNTGVVGEQFKVSDKYLQELHSRGADNLLRQAKKLIDNKLVDILTELLKKPAGITGFSDPNMMISSAETTRKFGTAAGLYDSSAAGMTPSAAQQSAEITKIRSITATTEKASVLTTASTPATPASPVEPEFAPVAKSSGIGAGALIGGAVLLGGAAYGLSQVKDTLDEWTTGEIILCRDGYAYAEACTDELAWQTYNNERLLAELQAQEGIEISLAESRVETTTCPHLGSFDYISTQTVGGQAIPASISVDDLKNKLTDTNRLAIAWQGPIGNPYTCYYKFEAKYDWLDHVF